MQKDYFFNGGGAPPSPPPPRQQFEWNANWGCSQDQYTQFGSGVTGAAVSGGYAVRELIGNICGAPPPFAADVSAQYAENNYNNVNNYNSAPPPPKPILGNSPLPLNPPPLCGGAGEITAAKLFCLGNRSFNSRTGQFGLKNGDLPCRSNGLQCIGNPKLPRISSTPSLKQAGSPVQNKNSNPTRPESGPVKISDDDFPVPDQLPTGPKSPTESNPRKRKPLSRKNAEEDDDKGTEFDDQTTAKRSKSVEAPGSDNNGVKTEDELINTANNTINNANNAGDIKLPEPPKDYIHVRARRGQATDSHSLAERVRREKISERMKLLQDLVPGCSKVTGKALMLDEIINYVQSLQRQVEFLSMKLATVNPRLDLNIDNLLTKDICQSNVSLPHTMYPLDSSAPAFHGQEQYPPDQIPQLHANLVNGMYSLDTSPSYNLGLKLPPVDGFDENLAQFPSAFEDDLQSIVHMGFNRISSKDTI